MIAKYFDRLIAVVSPRSYQVECFERGVGGPSHYTASKGSRPEYWREEEKQMTDVREWEGGGVHYGRAPRGQLARSNGWVLVDQSGTNEGG
jgi:hypothetical protein